ncbi:MAG: L,D-transpeptidase [Bacillota bacterium]
MKKLLQVIFVLTLTFFMFSAVNPTVGTDSHFANHSISSINDKKPRVDNNTHTRDKDDQAIIQKNLNAEQHSDSQKDKHLSDKEDLDRRDNRPSSKYRIDVCVGEQKVRIYDNDTVVKEWTVSTGKNGSTPLGHFSIQNRGEWFFSEKYQQGAMWWVSFKDWGVYLFHSVPMDRDKNVLAEEAAKLGIPASHGCIRLETDNARWIYDNIPAGTPVFIHE